MFEFFGQLFAVILCHAAENADKHFRAALFQRAQRTDAPPHFVFRAFTNTACVVQQQIGVLFCIAGRMTMTAKKGVDRFRIPFVHLTTVCMEIETHSIMTAQKL